MNNKGFMMAEVIVVASIILLALTGFYSLYTTTITMYDERLDYYDVSTLYKLANYRNKNSFTFSDGTKDYEKLLGVNGETIYLLKYIIFDNNGYERLVTTGGLNKTFVEYLSYLAESHDFNENAHILVMEKCDPDEDAKYTMNCKYAYLETAVK